MMMKCLQIEDSEIGQLVRRQDLRNLHVNWISSFRIYKEHRRCIFICGCNNQRPWCVRAACSEHQQSFFLIGAALPHGRARAGNPVSLALQC